MPNWREVLKEIGDNAAHHSALAKQATEQSKRAVDTVRHQYLEKLFNKRKRNIIAYYSGFLSKPEAGNVVEINDEDKNGFMMAVHTLDRTRGLDLMIHTPGGSIQATESIVNYLRKMFTDDIVAVVPQIAMSAGTMLACSCKEIIMATHSNLGPIDPWLQGRSTYGILKEFEKAYAEIKTDPMKYRVWEPILSQIPPGFLRQCELGIQASNSFVQKQLESVMFANIKPANNRRKKAEAITKSLSDADEHQTHSKHLHYEDCERIGLKVKKLEADPELQDLVLTVHHCYMHALMNTASVKMIENHTGAAFVKQMRMIAMPQQP